MKLAISSAALPDGDHPRYFPWLRARQIGAIEIAIGPRGVDLVLALEAYRAAGAAVGLEMVGLHLHPEAVTGPGPWNGEDDGRCGLDWLINLSARCRDLGGRTLILPAWRPAASSARGGMLAWRGFLETLLPRIEGHGTVLCLAPQPAPAGYAPAAAAMTARDCYLLANTLEHPAFGLHLGAAGLAATGEMGHATFAAVRGRLDHFHADEPGGGVLGLSGRIDHIDLRRHLAAISYYHWLTIVQRDTANAPADAETRLRDLALSIRFVTDHYLPLDLR